MWKHFKSFTKYLRYHTNLIKRIFVPHYGLIYHNTQCHIPHHPNVHTILMPWEICISYCMSTCVIYSWKNIYIYIYIYIKRKQRFNWFSKYSIACKVQKRQPPVSLTLVVTLRAIPSLFKQHFDAWHFPSFCNSFLIQMWLKYRCIWYQRVAFGYLILQTVRMWYKKINVIESKLS